MRPNIGFKKIHTEHTYSKTKKYARWDGQPKRAPNKGEYFISGAIPTAYEAKADMNTEYFIAVIVEW